MNTPHVNASEPLPEMIPSTTAKALRINLDQNIYGTFAEIGAGQETVRHFFRVGGASGTIAKAMSAYDKNFSDSVYGVEEGGRYVSEARLKKMLNHELTQLEQRLRRTEHPNKIFFVYANTVATIDFVKRYKGHGWVGIRFQLAPDEAYNDIIMHVRFRQAEARLQQETLGVMGVNLIYGAFYKHKNPKSILKYLYDHIGYDSLEIDTINFSGPAFSAVDNRLMSLQLIKNGMTESVIFNPQSINILPADLLYKKNIMALRGSFRPVTKVNVSMYEKSLDLFYKNPKVEGKNTEVIFEITLSNLTSEGEIDEQDFIDRADLLCSLGYTVMISNFKEYYRLVEYFSEYTHGHIGLVMGVLNLVEMFNEKYYQHLSGGILEAFGKIFYKDVKIYLYPMQDVETGEVLNSHNLRVDTQDKELYKFLKVKGNFQDILDYDAEVFKINSREVLKMISKGIPGWERMLPDNIADFIKEKRLFGYKAKN